MLELATMNSSIDQKIETPKLVPEKKRFNSLIEDKPPAKNVNLLRDFRHNPIQPPASSGGSGSPSLNNHDIHPPHPETQEESSLVAMARVLSTRKKLFLFLGVFGLISFLMGLGLPFLFQSRTLRNPPPSPLRGFESSVHDAEFGPLRLLGRGRVSRGQRDLGKEAMALLQDLFISVKTTKRFHFPRLVLLLETWVPLVKDQTWFFTDTEDPGMFERSGGHLIQTNCSSAHSRTALSCKMGVEFDHFLQSQKRWWCHFDDDNYVHVRRLAQILASYPGDYPHYLGKPSTAKPLEVSDPKNPESTSHFWFATGGAGFCVTRTMALKMAPYASGGKFIETGDKYWFPDDVTFGYIVEHLLGEHLTVVPEFHSHLESMKSIKEESLGNQISVSYINYNGVENVINIQGPFSEEVDPTRFYSLHCRLYDAVYCPKTEIR